MLPAALAAEWHRQREALLAEHPDLADDPDTLLDTLDGIADAGDVIARLVRKARLDRATAAALKTLQDDMAMRRARYEARGDRLEAAALSLMQAIGERKIERPDLTISVRAGRPELIVDDDALPDAFCAFTRRPDRVAIRNALTGGVEVPGARLGNAAPSLSVRAK